MFPHCACADVSDILASLDPVSKDNLSKLGVTKSFHQADLFWFSRPKLMLHLMQFVVFVLSLNVSMALIFHGVIDWISAIVMALSCFLVVVLFRKVRGPGVQPRPIKYAVRHLSTSARHIPDSTSVIVLHHSRHVMLLYLKVLATVVEIMSLLSVIGCACKRA